MESSGQPAGKRTIELTMLFFMSLGAIGLWANIFLGRWISVISPVTWNITDRAVDSFQIETAMIDSQGYPWFVVQKLSDGYELHHVKAEQADTWTLPALTYEEVMFIAVTKDQTNSPWLILGERLAHWDGTQWAFVPTPLQADLKRFMCPSIAARDSIVWGIDNATESTRLIRLDLEQDPVAGQEVSLPEGLDSQGYKFRCILFTGNDELLAVLSAQNQVDFYRLENLVWQKITSFQKEKDGNLHVGDVTTDSQGRIWILLKYWFEGKPVGQYDPKEDRWTWYAIEAQPEIADRFLDYEKIAVDDLERVWISASQYRPAAEEDSIGSHNYEAYAIGVFDEMPGDKLTEIRHYTTLNSNLETSPLAEILIGPDEKIWTWDKQLVWMDSRQPELPQTFAKWFITLTGDGFRMGLNIFTIVCIVPVLVIQLGILRRKRTRQP